MDFPPEEGEDEPTTSGRGRFDLRSLAEALPDYQLPFDTPPHDRGFYERHMEALARYYRVVSEGRVEVEAEVFPRTEASVYTLPLPALRYGNGRTPEEIGRQWRELAAGAVALADADPQGPRFANYDSYLIIHAGLGHETGALNDVRSVYLTGADLAPYGGPIPADDGAHAVRDVWILPEAVDDRGRAGLNGLLAKFFGHQLGLPALSNFTSGLPAIGGWSLMDVGANRLGFLLVGDELVYGFGFVPPQPLAWSKARLGWIWPLEVLRDTTVTILAGDRSPAPGQAVARAVRIPLTSAESLWLENRQQRGHAESDLPAGVQPPFADLELAWIRTDEADFSADLAGRPAGVWLGADEYDAFVPGSGILVWHVDDAVIAAAPEGMNNDRERPGIFLEEADGYRDIGNAYFDRQDRTEGTRADPFFAGGVDALRADGAPGSGTNTGLASGVSVRVLSAPGDQMRVAIRFERSAAGWPQPVAGARRAQTGDLDADGAPELLVEGEAGLSVFAPGRAQPLALRAPGRFVAADGALILAAAGGRLAALTYPTIGLAWESDVGTPPQAGLHTDALSGFGDVFAVAGEAGIRVLARTDGSHLLRDDAPVTGLAAADLDGDGDDDLVATGPLGAWRHEGDLAVVLVETAAGDSLLAPAAGDLDGDGRADVILAARSGSLQTVGQSRGDVAVDLGAAPVGPPALADLDGDGALEIVILTGEGVHALTAGGLRAPGFPAAPPRHHEAGALRGEPVAADLDGDGGEEVFAAAGVGIYGFDRAGRVLRGFPVLTSATPTAAPALADVDGDGALELVAVSGAGVHLWRPVAWEPAFAAGRAAAWSQAGGGAQSARVRQRTPPVSPGPTAGDLLPAGRAYCYPNPVGGGDAARVRFYLARPAQVALRVYDAGGDEVERVAAAAPRPAEENEIAWSVDGYASGLYLCQLTARGADGAEGRVLLRLAVSH